MWYLHMKLWNNERWELQEKQGVFGKCKNPKITLFDLIIDIAACEIFLTFSGVGEAFMA